MSQENVFIKKYERKSLDTRDFPFSLQMCDSDLSVLFRKHNKMDNILL